MVAKNNFQNPAKHDAELLFTQFKNNTFAFSDIRGLDLELDIRELLLRGIIKKISRNGGSKKKQWTYQLKGVAK